MHILKKFRSTRFRPCSILNQSYFNFKFVLPYGKEYAFKCSAKKNNSLGREIASTVDFLLLDPTLRMAVRPRHLGLLGTNQLRLFPLLTLEER